MLHPVFKFVSGIACVALILICTLSMLDSIKNFNEEPNWYGGLLLFSFLLSMKGVLGLFVLIKDSKTKRQRRRKAIVRSIR